LVYDKVRYRPVGLHRRASSALPFRCRGHDTLGDQPVEDSFGADRQDASDGMPAIGHHDLLAAAHSLEVTAQVIAKLAYANFHPTLLNVATLMVASVATSVVERALRIARSERDPTDDLLR